MEAQSPRTVVLDIKDMINRKGLSVPDILKLLEEEGEPQSETTIRRLVRPGSEDNDHFDFERTIKPIADAFFRRFKANDALAQAQIDLYRHISEFKLEEIYRLREQIEHMREEHSSKCRKCEENTELMKSFMKQQQQQLDLKDRRMDEQKERTDRLLHRIEQLTDALVVMAQTQEGVQG